MLTQEGHVLVEEADNMPSFVRHGFQRKDFIALTRINLDQRILPDLSYDEWCQLLAVLIQAQRDADTLAAIRYELEKKDD